MLHTLLRRDGGSLIAVGSKLALGAVSGIGVWNRRFTSRWRPRLSVSKVEEGSSLVSIMCVTPRPPCRFARALYSFFFFQIHMTASHQSHHLEEIQALLLLLLSLLPAGDLVGIGGVVD